MASTLIRSNQVNNSDGWTPVSDTWTYSSVDGPTGVITIPSDGTTKYSVGMRVKFTQTTVKYFIITAIAATTMTVYGGTDYTLANAAISAISYSTQKAPFGFPQSPAKWTQTLTDTSDRRQTTPTASTFYAPGSLSIAIPIGVWNVRVSWYTNWAKNASTAADITTALSTSTNSVSDSNLQGGWRTNTGVSGNGDYAYLFVANTTLALAAKTTYNCIIKTDQSSVGSISIYNNLFPLSVTCLCAYL